VLVSTITIPNLALAFIPVVIVLILMWRWGQSTGNALQAVARMLIQLTLVGYVLIYIFDTDSGGGSTLILITQGVLRLDPWYQPSYMIPLAGMIFSASMTNISLALERLQAETANGLEFAQARDIAFRAAMIPVINSFFAVGLISLPGMMKNKKQ
jgi:putative ABC transport system permease protein